jgi:hypothetical protein
MLTCSLDSYWSWQHAVYIALPGRIKRGNDLEYSHEVWRWISMKEEHELGLLGDSTDGATY